MDEAFATIRALKKEELEKPSKTKNTSVITTNAKTQVNEADKAAELG